MAVIGRDLNRSRERIDTKVFTDASEISKVVAKEIAQRIREKASRGEKCLLGLATGSTPTEVYTELIRMHREEGLSFAHVVTFNLDEYFPMPREAMQSYTRFMYEHLFDHVDIEPANVHIPDGTLPQEAVAEFCDRYERQIAEHGGIDIQLLGIGRTGHVGFNEPGSGPDSRTRLITLDRMTRQDAASDFFGQENVPRRGITMGVGTILDARRVILLAFGENKAPIIAKAVEEEVSASVPASFLQRHPNATIMLDKAAAAKLTRFELPWILGPVEWTPESTRKAVIWVAGKLNKAILKLTDEDYNENHLQDLLAKSGPAYAINIRVFRSLQATITGWPAGKPADARQPGDIIRPHDDIFPKRVVVFSPHPDDDVISMGGTLIRLAEQGHEVHVAYQTSGSIAVFDHDTIRFADFATEFNRMFDIDRDRSVELERHIEQFVKNKAPGQVDSEQVQMIKTLIRRGEAKAAGRHCGVELQNLHFLDMPFYETGTVVKKPLGEEDIALIVDLFQRIRPHQVYAAGDLSDPHGTHRTCLRAIFEALDRVRDEAWCEKCEVWLYRGAWQEWDPDMIDMAVPLSPQELLRKREAIFKHESQKDKAMFPGVDEREFWQRSETRNRRTAQLYDALGLAEFEAIEAFRRWRGERS